MFKNYLNYTINKQLGVKLKFNKNKINFLLYFIFIYPI